MHSPSPPKQINKKEKEKQMAHLMEWLKLAKNGALP
jgi:hypothetical protein